MWNGVTAIHDWPSNRSRASCGGTSGGIGFGGTGQGADRRAGPGLFMNQRPGARGEGRWLTCSSAGCISVDVSTGALASPTTRARQQAPPRRGHFRFDHCRPKEISGTLAALPYLGSVLSDLAVVEHAHDSDSPDDVA